MPLSRKIQSLVQIIPLILLAFTASAHGQPVRAWPSLQSSRIAFDVPAPISSKEVERYGAILSLSEAQRLYLDHLYEMYCNDCHHLEQSHQAAVIAVTQPLINRAYTGYIRDARTLDEDRAFCEEENAFCIELTKTDEMFLAQVDSILSDSQKPLFQRVEFHRKRARRIEYFTIFIAKANVDFSAMIEAFQADEITPALESVMWDYEREITPSFDKLQADSRQALIDLVTVRRDRLGPDGQLRKLTDPVELQAYQAAARQSEESVRTKTLATQLRIAKVNDEFLPKFTERMSQHGAAQFKANYFAAVYQHVFPDRYDPEPLYVEVRSCPDLSDELRKVIDEQWTAYRKAYDAICADMMAESDRWQEQGARTGMTDGYEEHNSKMEHWAEQRLDKSKEFVNRMKGMLPENVLVQKLKSIKLWQDDNEQALAAERKSIHAPVDFK